MMSRTHRALGADSSFTRQAVTKHLHVLEGAGLVRRCLEQTACDSNRRRSRSCTSSRFRPSDLARPDSSALTIWRYGNIELHFQGPRL